MVRGGGDSAWCRWPLPPQRRRNRRRHNAGVSKIAETSAHGDAVLVTRQIGVGGIARLENGNGLSQESKWRAAILIWGTRRFPETNARGQTMAAAAAAAGGSRAAKTGQHPSKTSATFMPVSESEMGEKRRH